MRCTASLCLGSRFEISSSQMDLPLGHATSTETLTFVFTARTQLHPQRTNKHARPFPCLYQTAHTHTQESCTRIGQTSPSIFNRNISTTSALIEHFSTLCCYTTILKITAIWLSSFSNGMLLLQLRNVKTTTTKAKMHEKEKKSKQKKNQTSVNYSLPTHNKKTLLLQQKAIDAGSQVFK